MTMMMTTTTMASARRAIGYDTIMAADDKDNEVDGDGATDDDDGDGATGDEVDDDVTARWATTTPTTMATARRDTTPLTPQWPKLHQKRPPQFIPPNIYLFLCMPL